MTLSQTIAACFFWISLGGIVYSYAAYPLLLAILAHLFGKRIKSPLLDYADLPSLSLLIAAHNEEEVIEQRIEIALAMDYPREKLEILIASDGSTDSTAAIAARFTHRGVRLLDFPTRRGKSALLNDAIRQASGEIILLSDANTRTNGNAARLLARWFVDPHVGAVCGRLVLIDPKSGTNVDSLYWKYETFLKKRESQLGALLGSNGAIYALRAAHFQPIPDRTLIDDFVIPLKARLQSGCAIIYDAEAIAREETAPRIGTEFRRRTRIGTGDWQAIALLWRLLNPARGWIAFTFFSHKILRWVCPFFMIAMIASNLHLSPHSSFFHAILRVQIALYTLAAAGAIVPQNLPLSKFLRLANMFLSMNAALFLGFYKWLTTPHTGIWARTPRS
jgi:cellulose synthase/poly-beta-1,6-N-acetylglucosamine synthase-like glycosyltransferase